MMWQTYKFYAGISEHTLVVDPKFTKNVPDWPMFDKIVGSMWVRIMWAALYLLFFIKFATSPYLYLLYPVVLVMSPVHGAVINWYAHKFGYKNFEMKNTSTNLLMVDFLMLGEAYHNNHHKYPSSPNFGRKWHEIDPVYPFIKLFNALGIIKINKPVPELQEA